MPWMGFGRDVLSPSSSKALPLTDRMPPPMIRNADKKKEITVTCYSKTWFLLYKIINLTRLQIWSLPKTYFEYIEVISQVINEKNILFVCSRFGFKRTIEQGCVCKEMYPSICLSLIIPFAILITCNLFSIIMVHDLWFGLWLDYWFYFYIF